MFHLRIKNKKQNNKKNIFCARVKSRGGDPNGKKTFYSVTNSEEKMVVLLLKLLMVIKW